jgi:hypothetical protein
MMMGSPFGQLGLWAPFSGVRDAFTLIAYDFTYSPPPLSLRTPAAIGGFWESSKSSGDNCFTALYKLEVYVTK